MDAEGSAPAIIIDHPFVPRAEWWGLCECGLSESAHATTTINVSYKISTEPNPSPLINDGHRIIETKVLRKPEVLDAYQEMKVTDRYGGMS